MAQKTRVRFAPSPTGPLHIGGVRTALYNYLFAKNTGGEFVLRIEDTDQTRYVEGAEKYIVDSLNWLNIPYDEGPGKEGDCGPYRQSERKHLYKKYADHLVENDWAYLAFDSAASLGAIRKEHEAEGQTFVYNRASRQKLNNSLALSAAETQAKIDAGDPYVIRFKTPTGERLFMHDEVRGGIEIDTDTLDDKILFKSDGMPTYHLANIVDDHLMRITHVIRGEEWLPSLALHVLLYRAFGWEAPKFAHLPLILKPHGKGKLSKRDGDKGGFPVFPLAWKAPDSEEVSAGYREEGYLPQAVVNMLAFLGWNPGTEQEFFDLEELSAAFDLKRVHKAGAKFDPEKTKWFQHHYFQKEADSDLAAAFMTVLEEKEISASLAFAEQVVGSLKERASFVADFWAQGHFYFEAPKEYAPKATKKAWKNGTPEIMSQVAEILQAIDDFTAENTQAKIKEWITNEGLGFGKVMQPLRLVLVGDMKGPDLFEIASLLGKEESIRRIRTAISTLS